MDGAAKRIVSGAGGRCFDQQTLPVFLLQFVGVNAQNTASTIGHRKVRNQSEERVSPIVYVFLQSAQTRALIVRVTNNRHTQY